VFPDSDFFCSKLPLIFPWPSFFIWHGPCSNMAIRSSRYNFWPSLVKLGWKLLELESGLHAKCLKHTKWPRDLVFDPAWPIFKLDLDIILIQHLTKFGEHRMKTTWIGERTLITDGSKDRQTDQPTSSLLYTPLNFVFGGIIKAKKSLPDLVTFCVLCFNVLFFIFLLSKWSFALNKGFFVDNKVFSPDNVLGVS